MNSRYRPCHTAYKGGTAEPARVSAGQPVGTQVSSYSRPGPSGKPVSNSASFRAKRHLLVKEPCSQCTQSHPSPPCWIHGLQEWNRRLSKALILEMRKLRGQGRDLSGSTKAEPRSHQHRGKCFFCLCPARVVPQQPDGLTPFPSRV